MENLVYCFIITAVIAFWLGRKTKPSPSLPDSFASDAFQSKPLAADPSRIPMNGPRLMTLIFIIGWLIAWTAGICMAFVMFISSFGNGFATVFVGGWLVAAVGGWFFAVNTIHKLATGKPLRGQGLR